MSSQRFSSVARYASKVVLICLSLFQIYVSIVGVMTPLVQRSMHLSFGLTAAFLVYGTTKRQKPGLLSLVLACCSAFVASYPLFNLKFITEHQWLIEPLSPLDLLVGGASILLILEATRRAAGLPFMLLCLFLVVYPSLPLVTGPIAGYPGYSPGALIDWMYFTLEGIFGVSLGVSTTTIFPFILMGAFLEKVGITDFFNDLAKTLVGFMRGGPAKVSVVSSAFFGTVSGSAVANVMVDGQFTIPTMVKAGYAPHTAAAVEAVASTGGYITPPVMGAVAFLMAEIIGVSYWTIALCAVLPAALYYIALFVQVHLRACALGLQGIPRRELPSKVLLLKRIYYLFPLGLLVFMLSSDYSPYTSCIAALVATLPIGFFLKTERIGIRDIVAALEDGAKGALLIIVTCAGAGFILGCLSMTGLGILLCGAIVKLSAGNLIMTLLLAMLVNIFIGMGVGSPIAAYLALVGTTVPVIIQLGVPKIAAHMYTLYFANVSYITPPVAMAVFAAAAIAKTSIWKTGWAAMRLGIGGFIVPFMFVYDPSLLLIGSAPEVIVSFATAVVGVVALCVVVEGWFYTRTNRFERFLFLLGGVFLIAPSIVKDLVGASLIAAAILLNRQSARKAALALQAGGTGLRG